MKRFLCWLLGHEMTSWAVNWVEVRSTCRRCGQTKKHLFWY